MHRVAACVLIVALAGCATINEPERSVGPEEPLPTSSACGPFHSLAWEDEAGAQQALAARGTTDVRVERTEPAGLQRLPPPEGDTFVTMVEWIPDAAPDGRRPARDTLAFTLTRDQATLVAPAGMDADALSPRAQEFLRNATLADEGARGRFVDWWLAAPEPAAYGADDRLVTVLHRQPFDLPPRVAALLFEVAANEATVEARTSGGPGQRERAYTTWSLVLQHPVVTFERAEEGIAVRLVAEADGAWRATAHGSEDAGAARAAVDALLADLALPAAPDRAMGWLEPPCPHGDG